jgi:hypothetical protein
MEETKPFITLTFTDGYAIAVIISVAFTSGLASYCILLGAYYLSGGK